MTDFIFLHGGASGYLAAEHQATNTRPQAPAEILLAQAAA